MRSSIHIYLGLPTQHIIQYQYKKTTKTIQQSILALDFYSHFITTTNLVEMRTFLEIFIFVVFF